jgi:hypothetical protein
VATGRRPAKLAAKEIKTIRALLKTADIPAAEIAPDLVWLDPLFTELSNLPLDLPAAGVAPYSCQSAATDELKELPICSAPRVRYDDSALIDSAEQIAGPKPVNGGQTASTPNWSDTPAGELIMPSVEGLFPSECLHGVYSGSPSRGNPSGDQDHAHQEQNRYSKANGIARPQAIEH